MTPINKAISVEAHDEISFKDIIQFAKKFYKKIIFLGIAGAIFGLTGAVVIGEYTASITFNNYNGLDLPRIRYLQSALPKLEQENQKSTKNKVDSFLSSETFWAKSIKPNILIGKADGKEMLDPSALKAAGSKISSIEIIGKAKTKEDAIIRVEKVSKFFIDGSAYIDLRELVRAYELKSISIDSNLKKKINSAEVELDYLQKRIKNLNHLKEQFPATTAMSGQVLDAKDSGAKYLPITTQIVAATTDANNLKESLARYRDEEYQNIVYKQFAQKARPLVEGGQQDTQLIVHLLQIIGAIEKDISSTIQLIAIEEIKIALLSIETNKVYGLKQTGDVNIKNPPYLKYLLVGLLAGLFAGLLWACGLKLTEQTEIV